MTLTNILLLLGLLVGLACFAYVFVGARRLEEQRNQRVAREAGTAPAAMPPPVPPPVAAPAPPAPAATAPAPSAPPAAVAPPPAAATPFLAAPDGPPDDLMRIKGIGPKLAARLAELGVFHYAQIAAWTPAQLAEVDSRLGNFQGRPARDQWQSQAALLAAGDIKAYERVHGKLGPAAGPA
jgi:predicted flap endonuclease-1-like 5' DNA nuclease